MSRQLSQDQLERLEAATAVPYQYVVIPTEHLRLLLADRGEWTDRAGTALSKLREISEAQRGLESPHFIIRGWDDYFRGWLARAFTFSDDPLASRRWREGWTDAEASGVGETTLTDNIKASNVVVRLVAGRPTT